MILLKISLIVISPFWIMLTFMDWWEANGGYKPYGQHPPDIYFAGILVLSIFVGLVGIHLVVRKFGLGFQLLVGVAYTMFTAPVLFLLAAAPVLAKL